MTDILTPEKRSENMSRIQSRDTSIELKVRKLIYSMGLRYRVNRKDLPGKPDIVIEKYKLIIQVHGCYWHRHPDCKLVYSPKSRVDFWQKKFSENVSRDKKVEQELVSLGYRVFTIWECEAKNENNLINILINILPEYSNAIVNRPHNSH